MPTVRIICGALVAAALLLPAAAHAATPAQIHADAADGVIDGTYSMAEMRAADDGVSAEHREYYGWNEAYGAYLRGLSQLPTAVPSTAAPSGARAPVPAGGYGGGTAVGREKRPARDAGNPVVSAALEPMLDENAASSNPDDIEAVPGADSGDVAAAADAQESPAADAEPLAIDDGSGGFPFVFLLLAVPLAVLSVGAWRSVRQRAAARETERALLGE